MERIEELEVKAREKPGRDDSIDDLEEEYSLSGKRKKNKFM